MSDSLRKVLILLLLGAVSPAAGAEDRAVHWSFVPPQRPELPEVSRRDWPRNGIDHFILARLDQAGLAPSPEAGKVTLIRRVTLDLTGLPPSHEEVEAFLRDRSSDAYERVVDRLLDSPHYGERWARPWLDLAHYADTDGYLTDQLRPVAWRHRQWVVDAINRDLPFDQFTIEQLAGDLLPHATLQQRMATGFLRHTLSNREGGADLEEFRVKQVIDRTNTFGAVWLGLTVGCAQCHDHKYDPLTQREYYELYAFLNAADEVNIDAPLPEQRDGYLASLPEYEAKWEALVAAKGKGLIDLQRRWEERLLQAAAHPGEDAQWDRYWELLGLIWGGGLGEGQLEGVEIVKLDPAKRTALDRRRILDYFLQHGSVIDPDQFKQLQLDELRGELDKIKAALPNVTRAPTMREARNPRRTSVHIRGDFRDPGAAVSPDTPNCLPPLPEGVDRNRLALARWLVSRENPLTSRVTVNRMWQEFFGRGLVETSDDFGARGAQPSHPQFLDWLASEFARSEQGGIGWSRKRLIRLIVTSATYRQSSVIRPELARVDPENRLLARQSSLRLSAEAVRDATLAASGMLSRKVGGPSVFPPQSERVTMEAFGSNAWNESQGEDRYRRGLYTFLIRTAPFAQGTTFDAPSPNHTCTRRERSNTPLQALTLLNDPVFFEAAQALARRILNESSSEPPDRIDDAFRLCLARRCTDAERSRLLSYLTQQTAIFRKEPAAVAQIAPNPPQSVNPVEAAAWTGVASVLLNLHEFITRD